MNFYYTLEKTCNKSPGLVMRQDEKNGFQKLVIGTVETYPWKQSAELHYVLCSKLSNWKTNFAQMCIKKIGISSWTNWYKN